MFDKIANYTIGGFSLSKILLGVIILAVCVLLSRLLLRVLDKGFAKRGNPNLRAFAMTAIKVALYTFSLLIAMDYVGIPITTFVAIISVAGLAISLALQDVLGNIFSGVTLLSAKPFVKGDYISAGKVEGEVVETGLLYTKVRTNDNKIIVVPNGILSKAEITNFTSEKQRRIDLELKAPYSATTPVIKEAVFRAAAAEELVLKDPAPFVGINSMGDRFVSYTVRVWCATGDYWTLYYRIWEGIRRELTAAGVDMEVNKYRLER